MRLPAFAFLVSCKDELPRTTTRAEGPHRLRRPH
jgi:hypothetical protein